MKFSNLPMDHQSDILNKNSLPFTLGIATLESEIQEVCRHRSLMYSKHNPELGAKLIEPEERDTPKPGQIIIVARSRLDRGIIGSIRVHLNNETPLPIESCVELPQHIHGCLLMESTRLSSSGGSVCRNALCKAAILYAQHHKAVYCVIAAKPSLVHLYEAIGFTDLISPMNTYPIPYANNIEHRVLGLPLEYNAYHQTLLHLNSNDVYDFYTTIHTSINETVNKNMLPSHSKRLAI